MHRATLFLAFAVTACSSSSASSSSAPKDAGPAWVSDGHDLDTWVSYAQGFTAEYCVECHGAGNSKGLDFTQHSIVTVNADLIRCGVCVQQDPSWHCASTPTAEQFPISDSTNGNPKPTDAERDRFVAWLSMGAP